MLTVKVNGDFSKTEKFLKQMSSGSIYHILDSFAKEGVTALENATPVASGLTAKSWSYKIESNSRVHKITWLNDNIVDGRPIAIMLQYGHATGTGGYVQGVDYINPALKPLMDKIADGVWKAVTSA